MKFKNEPIVRFLRLSVPVRLILFVFLAPGVLVTSLPAWCQLAPGSMDVHWNEGAANCANSPQAPLQVHPYNARTFILRENPCATFEAPFTYLLIGSTKALLIDTGDVADPNQMPLATTVMGLLPGDGSAKLPLLVVHTHRHLDHRAGDGQFSGLSNVEVVGYDLDSVRRYYNFSDWPNGVAQINLGDRTVNVVPTPGHNETEVSFYDGDTGLFFSGDFLMPGRLLIDDASADLASAERVAAFVKDRPVSFVLGGHIELNSAGNTFPWGAQYHPHEHVLQMTKDDLLALPAAIRGFNGFYAVRGNFILMNSTRVLIVEAVLAIAVIVAIVWILVGYIRRRRRGRRLRVEIQA
jgi:hydroxyacylglutathione hydrolase